MKISGRFSSAKQKNKKKSNNNKHCEIGLRAGQVNPKRAESAVVEDDCFDLGRRLDGESCNGENDGLWLSSDCNNPSSFFSEYELYDLPHLLLDEWRIFFDGSTINPIEEACLALEKNLPDTEKILQEDLKEEEVVTWLLSSTENNATLDSSSVGFSESSSPSFEDSVSSDSKSKFSGLDLDRTGFWVLELISDSESEMDSLQSYKSIFRLSVSIVGEVEDFKTDEPLFWPFKQVSDWNSGNWDCFSMSPRRDSWLKESMQRVSRDSRPTDGKVLNQIFLEEEFAANEELPIEKLLGLDEFDGHEGVDLEFSQDGFFL